MAEERIYEIHGARVKRSTDESEPEPGNNIAVHDLVDGVMLTTTTCRSVLTVAEAKLIAQHLVAAAERAERSDG